MRHYWDEFDSHAAQWLRELIRGGHLPDGEVDGRDIREVRADDLRGFVSCHFFGGIGGWWEALRLAGWPADRPVWTGSCPCQPYSAAGKRKGDADPRNLWPEFFRLIRECRPQCVFGEQVEGAIKHGWLDRVSADLEGEGYAVGAAVLGAHSVGAPHIRQRLYWVAHHAGAGRGERRAGQAGERRADEPERLRPAGPVADAGRKRRQQDARSPSGDEVADGGSGRDRGQPHGDYLAGSVVPVGGLANADGGQSRDGRVQPRGQHGQQSEDSGSCVGVALGDADGAREGSVGGVPGGATTQRPGGVGFWDAFDLIPCRDGKARRVEPGTFPLAHGVSGRVGLLRGYGNALVPQVAAEFVAAFLEAEAEVRAEP